MFRLDEKTLREDEAYREAYRLARAHRAHIEAVYRGLYDAIVDTLAIYFTRAMEEPPNGCDCASRSHRSQRSQRPFLG